MLISAPTDKMEIDCMYQIQLISNYKYINTIYYHNHNGTFKFNNFSFHFQGVIIIYEYSTITNSKPKNNLRQNWLSLMNNSLEAMPFEVKFDKTKLNPATIQILPLILKTIKKNVYFDKIIEDSVNLSTTYEKKESTEEISYKSAPETTKNWVRFPVSKLYTIEYKTSPILYFKNPSKNIEYFTKIRKIRDYQRVMNYVDKMISDKVSLGTTIPMAKYIYNAYRIPSMEYTTPITKAKRGDEEFKNIKKKLIATSTQTKESKCSCKESVKDLLSKFIINLKELLPSATDQAHNTTTPCKVHQSIKQVKISDKETQTINNLLNNSLHDTPIEISGQNSRLSEKYQIKNEKQHDFTKCNKPEVSIKNISQKYDYFYKTFIRKQNLMDPNIKVNSNKHQSMTIQNVENKSIQNKEITTFPGLQTNYKDYTSTQSNIIDYFKVLDAHSLELVKRKIIPGRKKVNLLKDKSDKSIMKNISSFLPVYNTSEPSPKAVFFNNSEINDSEYINVIPTTYTTARSDFIDTTIQQFTTDTTTLDKLVTERSYNSSTVKDSMFAFDNLTVEEEIDKISTENPEISIKKLENMIKKLNNSTVYSNSNKASEYEWELVNVVDDKYHEDVPNSMIPQSRSSYLEIQRNEWKNEEQHDYDNNLNNYLFE